MRNNIKGDNYFCGTGIFVYLTHSSRWDCRNIVLGWLSCWNVCL